MKLSYRQARQIKLRCFREGIEGVTIQDVVELAWDGVVLDTFQHDIIGSILLAKDPAHVLQAHERLKQVFIKGCTKAGKGASVAMAACLWLDESDEAKVIVSSSRFEHARDVMFAEIVHFWKKMKGGGSGVAYKESIEDHEKKYCKITNPENGESFCFSEDTEVMTARGWVPWPEITTTDQFCTFNRKSGYIGKRLLETEYQYASHLTADPYQGEMYLYKTDDADFCVTPNHRMLLEDRSFIKIKDIQQEVELFEGTIFLPEIIQKPRYDGKVYCATVPNGTLYTRRNGVPLWSGNSGHHGPATLFIFDEASSSQQTFFNMATTQARCIVALSNPRTLGGWFRNGFPPSDPDETQTINIPGGKRRLVTISGFQCRNVIEGKEVIPNQLTKDILDGIMAQGDWFANIFGHGKFPQEDPEKQVVTGSWIDAANEFHKELTSTNWNPLNDEDPFPVQAFGLDVARTGVDNSILAAGGERGCKAIHELHTSDTMQVVSKVLLMARDLYNIDLPRAKRVPICIDVDGLGGGVADRLKEMGCWVIENYGNTRAEDLPEMHENQRTENYSMLGKRLNPDESEDEESWALPYDTDLKEELCAHEKVYKSDAVKFGLLPKENKNGQEQDNTIKGRIGRSPDRSDTVAYLYRAVRYLPQRPPVNPEAFRGAKNLEDLEAEIRQFRAFLDT